MNYKGKLYTGKVNGKHILLGQTAEDVDNLIKSLKDCIYSLRYAAFNLDGTKDEDIPKGIIESTSPSVSAIISARNAELAIKKFRNERI